MAFLTFSYYKRFLYRKLEKANHTKNLGTGALDQMANWQWSKNQYRRCSNIKLKGGVLNSFGYFCNFILSKLPKYPQFPYDLHVSNFSIQNNSNLNRGGYSRAILSNWGINCSKQKFRRDIEKGVKIQAGKM